MKKALLTALAVMASLSLYAQGTINFANDAASKVLLQNQAGTISSAPSGSTYTVGLWWAAAGTTDESAFTMVASGNLFKTGLFSLGTVQIDGIAPGAVVNVQVRGWQTAGGSYNGAQAAGNMYFGKTSIFSIDTGNPNATPTAELPTDLIAGNFTGLTLQVPEPSTIALGLLGLAGLFILRRRS
jgi:predicted RecA/RadA family phage recombinase